MLSVIVLSFYLREEHMGKGKEVRRKRILLKKDLDLAKQEYRRYVLITAAETNL